MQSRAPSSAEPAADAPAREAAARAAAARVGAVSRALGASFAEQVVPRAAGVEPARVAAWADAVLALRADGGWRGERLAHALVASAPAALACVDAAALSRWIALADHVRGVVDDAQVFALLPAAVRGWSTDEVAGWLDLACALPPPAALACYRDLPAGLARVAPAVRADVVAALRRAAPVAAAEVAAVMPVAAALVGAVPPTSRRTAAALLLHVATQFPAGVPGLLRSLPRLHEDAPPARIAAWAESGLELAREHAAAGVAYFALASRTSLRRLRDEATAVAFEEVQGVLRRVVHMLSGTPAVPYPSGRFTLRPPLEDVPERDGIALPAVVDRLPTWEGNARLHVVVAALLAGRRTRGTYAPDAAVVDAVRAADAPAALEDLFLLADGVRVAAALSREYPGLADELRWTGAAILRDAAPPPLFDALLALALAGDAAPPTSPWLAGTAALVLPSLAPLTAAGATAADALAAARALAPLFADVGRGVAGDVVPDLVTLLLDPGDGEGPPPAEGAAVAGVGGGDAEPEPLPAELAEELALQLDERVAEALAGGARAMTAEELQALVEAALRAALGQARGAVAEQAGLYVTQLLGKRLADGTLPLERVDPAPRDATAARRARPGADDGPVHVYDEWDHTIADYRPAWCRLREIEPAGDSGVYFDRALARHQELVPEIRRCFQRVRPELYRPVRNLEDGDDVDLNAAVDARAQRRARHTPSGKLYTRRERQERDVATLFLLDMSASTDETAADSSDRIIDIAKDALVVMAAALEEIGDAYAIYGFSGQGRDHVEVYPIKRFGERLGPLARSRIGGIEPRGSTRMGAALRHVLGTLRAITAPSRHLVLLSDGFPQDLDYGDDRQSHVYGIRDTAVALREVSAAGVRPFCITVDLAGHDYLREMCAPEQYVVIGNVAALPRELPKIYQRLVHAA